MEPGSNPLLTDLYQLNMIEAYLACGETKTAVFELFVRRLPASAIPDDRRPGASPQVPRGFALRRRGNRLAQRHQQVQCPARLTYLSDLRFRGDVHAMQEGTIFFANEPVLTGYGPAARGPTC